MVNVAKIRHETAFAIERTGVSLDTAIAPRWLHGSAPHPVQPRVPCPIHLPHPTLADEGGHVVVPEAGTDF